MQLSKPVGNLIFYHGIHLGTKCTFKRMLKTVNYKCILVASFNSPSIMQNHVYSVFE